MVSARRVVYAALVGNLLVAATKTVAAILSGVAVVNFNTGYLDLNHSTLSGNDATLAGGGTWSNDFLIAANSIIAGNTAPADADISGQLLLRRTSLSREQKEAPDLPGLSRDDPKGVFCYFTLSRASDFIPRRRSRKARIG